MSAAWHPENPALLAGVVGEAEADAPRLVYADWLEEHGDYARAEFIRTACALVDKSAADPDYPDLVERRSLALAAIRMRKMKPALPPGIGFRELIPNDDDTAECSFHRGLPYFARVPSIERGGLTPQHIQQWCAALPSALETTTLRGLYFYEPAGFRSALADILREPAFAHFTALAGPNADPQASSAPSLFELLAASRHPPRVTWLDTTSLSALDLDLLGAPAFADLTRLDLGALSLNQKQTAQLAKKAWWRNLRRVSIGLIGRAAGAGLKALAQLPGLHDLTLYDFPQAAAAAWKGCDFPALSRIVFAGPRPGAAFGRSREGAHFVRSLSEASAPCLSALEFRSYPPGAEELRALTETAWWPQLHTLHFPGGGLSPNRLPIILESSCAPGLRSIKIHRTAKGQHTALLRLLEPGRLPQLSTLVLEGCFPHDESAQELVAALAAADAPRLRHLALNGAPMGDAGALAIAGNSSLRLARLELTHCGLTEAGMQALLAAPQLDGLRQLRLSGNEPGMALAKALCDPDVLRDLVDLDLPLVTDSALYQQLRQARPGLFY